MKITLNRIYVSLLVIMVSVLFVQCNGNPDFVLQQLVKESNKLCPMQVDEITVLDSCEVLPNKVIRNNYTINSNDMPENGIAIFDLYAYKGSIRSMQNATDMGTKKFISLNATIKQRYYNKQGQIISEITITPDEYNKKPDMQSDEYAFNEIKQIVKAYQTKLPMKFEDSVTTTKIEASYPRTVNYTVEKSDYEKTASFDSIQFKNERKGFLIEDAKSNIYKDLLDGANIRYKYIFLGKNQQYLCTLDITPEDYK